MTSLDSLGLAYQQLARETGYPSYYAKSDEALHRALRLAPRDLIATSGLGSLALSRHRFRDALALGRRAHAISPTTARNYGVIGDALVELGRYREGFRAFDTMAGIRPDLSSYARISHARELLGDVPGAISAMKLALETSAGQGEPEAWAHVQLGKLYFSVGRFGAAAAEDRARSRPSRTTRMRSMRSHAQRPPAAAMARRSPASRKRSTGFRSRSTFDARRPLPRHRARRQARRQYALIRVIERLLVANGVKTDLETALFDVDHGIRLGASLALARMRSANGRRSTGTTSWLGRSSGTGFAAKRSAIRGARFGSGRSTRSRSSTAG